MSPASVQLLNPTALPHNQRDELTHRHDRAGDEGAVDDVLAWWTGRSLGVASRCKASAMRQQAHPLHMHAAVCAGLPPARIGIYRIHASHPWTRGTRADWHQWTSNPRGDAPAHTAWCLRRRNTRLCCGSFGRGGGRTWMSPSLTPAR